MTGARNIPKEYTANMVLMDAEARSPHIAIATETPTEEENRNNKRVNCNIYALIKRIVI